MVIKYIIDYVLKYNLFIYQILKFSLNNFKNEIYND